MCVEVASRLKCVYFRYYRQNDDCPGVEEKVEVHLLHSYRYLFFEIVSREKRGGGRERRDMTMAKQSIMFLTVINELQFL